METLTKPISDLLEHTEQKVEEATDRVVDVVSDQISSALVVSDVNTIQHTNEPQSAVSIKTTGTTDDMYSCAMTVDSSIDNISKLVFLGNVEWSTSHDEWTVLMTRRPPIDFMSENSMPQTALKRFFRFFRGGASVTVNLSSPPGTQGLLLLFYTPINSCVFSASNFQAKLDKNTLFSLPHQIVDIRCTNTATLTVPFVSNKNYVDYGAGEVFGTFGLTVLSQLKAASGVPAVTVSMYGQLIEPDFQCPVSQGKTHGKKKFVDNNVSKPPVLMHSIINSTPGAANAANSLSTNHAESMALAGESTIVDYRTVGCIPAIQDLVEICRKWVLISYTTWQASAALGHQLAVWDFKPWDYGVLGAVLQNFQFFRGSFELKIVTVASNFTIGKFQVTWYPSEATNSRTLSQCRNGVYVVSDTGCNPPILTLPFTSNKWRRVTSGTYGKIFMHVVNRLTATVNAPESVDVKIFLRAGPDFQLFCPKASRLPIVNNGGSEEVSQEPVFFINYEMSTIPIESSSHSDVRNYFGRATHYDTYELSSETMKTVWMDVPKIGTLQLARCVGFINTELVFIVVNHINDTVFVSHNYEGANPDDLSTLAGTGVVCVPSMGCKTINVPFYSGDPFRVSVDPHALGQLHLYSRTAGKVDLFVSFRNPNLFFPMSICRENSFLMSLNNDRIPNCSWVRDLTADGDVESNPGPKQGYYFSNSSFMRSSKTVVVKSEHFMRVERDCNYFGVLTYKAIVSLLFSEDKPYVMDMVETFGLGVFQKVIEHKYGHGVYEKIVGDERTRQELDWENLPINSCIKNLVENCWVLDLTQCGDVESNPGPNILIVGPSKSGKSYFINKLVGRDVCKTTCGPSICTRVIQKVQFGRWTLIDTPETFEFGDPIDGFIYVNSRMSTIQHKEYMNFLDRKFPNWRCHAFWVDYDPGFLMGKFENLSQFEQMVPYFRNYARIVYRDRGLYKHYGVKVGDQVYHLSTEDVMRSALSGTAQVSQSPWDDTWCYTNDSQYRTSILATINGMSDLKFSCDSTCETFARNLVESEGDQGRRFVYCLTVVAVMSFLSTAMVDHSPGLLQKILSLATGTTLASLECSVIKTVVRTVCRICCYLILYCHSPNILTTGVLVALLALDVTGFEVGGKQTLLLENLVNGNFSQVCEDIIDLAATDDKQELKEAIPKFVGMCHTARTFYRDAEDLKNMTRMAEEHGHAVGASCVKCLPPRMHTQDDNCKCISCVRRFCTGTETCLCDKCRGTTFDLDLKCPCDECENQGPKSFNDWTLAAKNVTWWLEGVKKIFEWVRDKLFPGDLERKLQEIEVMSGEIATVMALADEHIVRCRQEKDYIVDPKTREKHSILVDKLSTFLTMEMPVQLSHFQSKMNSLMSRLQSINFEPGLNYAHRPEPLGIWIQGDPGCGKSFLCHYLVTQLKKHYGWDAFSQPIGSNHMDGYLSQEIHIFDDLGQNRDEEDMALMCNLISSVPFIVPKAECTSKGIQYNGKVVIVTTNKRDFSSIKLADSGALKRRFPICLEIRPREQYVKTDEDGRMTFSAIAATQDGSISRGDCWDLNVGAHRSKGSSHWTKLNPEILVRELVIQLDARLSVAQFMNQGISVLNLDSDPKPFYHLFDRIPEGKVKYILSHLKEKLASVKSFIEKNRAWFLALGAIGSLVSIMSFIIPYFSKKRANDEVDDESPYGGSLLPKFLKNYKLPFKNQGSVNLKPIVDRLVNLSDENGDVVTALALGDKRVITYGHDKFSRCSFIKDEKVDFSLSDPIGVRYDDGPMDLVEYVVDMPMQFKDVNSKIHDGEYYGDGYLIWKENNQFLVLPVTNIHPTTQIRTKEGTTTSSTYTYIAKMWKGACGGVLVGIIDGNPKILGIHIAGSKCMGCSARLYPIFNQGKAKKVAVRTPYFQPRKSKIEASPLNTGCESMAPAVLSRNDRRLEIEVEDVTKLAAAKYVGNTYKPDDLLMETAKAIVVSDFSKVLSVCDEIDFEKAVDSSFLPIDWQTSSGHKFTGCPKSVLVRDEGFQKEVQKIIRGESTYFTTYLKDELRAKEKISLGKTRAIEAANFDYVVAYRMVMGNIMKKLFGDSYRVTGFYPGFDPYSSFDILMDNCKPWVVNLDFKSFDGSLSPEIMRNAVEILSCFHSKPDLVKMIHEPTIYSTNLVSDEVWFVDGGMCSGSPCTTLLNTVVNKLVNTYACLKLGLSREEFYIASFGDDTVISMDRKVDLSHLKELYLEDFGMTVTDAGKGDVISFVPKQDLTFLKRRPTLFPKTQKIVGCLDLQSMVDHIGWTKGNFQQQLDSFYMELVLHGKEVYDKVWRDNVERAPQYNHLSFEASWQIMYPLVMVV